MRKKYQFDVENAKYDLKKTKHVENYIDKYNRWVEHEQEKLKEQVETIKKQEPQLREVNEFFDRSDTVPYDLPYIKADQTKNVSTSVKYESQLKYAGKWIRRAYDIFKKKNVEERQDVIDLANNLGSFAGSFASDTVAFVGDSFVSFSSLPYLQF